MSWSGLRWRANPEDVALEAVWRGLRTFGRAVLTLSPADFRTANR
jgi:hypothetical protein